ncbi:MAG: ankyrin repeat domain-containing protein [Gammaproteobacteria bacterium]
MPLYTYFEQGIITGLDMNDMTKHCIRITGVAVFWALLLCISATALAEDPTAPLFQAAEQGDVARVKTLVVAGADVNAKDDSGLTPIQVAGLTPQGERVVEVLVRAGANPNVRVNGYSVLRWAKRPEFVRLLLEHGASPDDPDHMGFTSLMGTSQRGPMWKARMLIEAGADPNISEPRRGLTALSIAVQEENFELVRLLLEAGADPNHVILSRTIFDRIVSNFGPDVVRLFLDNGADPNKPSKDIPPLVSAYENPQDVMSLLLEAGVEFGKNEVLHRAITRRDLEAVVLMLSLGADVNNIGVYGLTPLHGAAWDNAPAIAQTLVAYGADTTLKDDKGRTPLDVAREKNAHEVLKVLSNF